MWRRLGFLIRRDERRPVAVAFAFLFGLVASHTALESARDGLFLARIPSDRLPIVYIAIAVLSFAAARLRQLVRGVSRRSEVTAYTLLTGLGTLGLGLVLPGTGDLGLYVLYVWTGVVTATVLVSLWTVLADVFTATQAKRVYGVIGLGGMIGAVVGSAVVTVLARVVSPRVIVFAASAGFFAVAFLPRALPGRADIAMTARPNRGGDPLLERFRANVRYATRGPYVWRLVGLALAGSTTVTLTDFVFKTTMAAQVPKEELTAAFAQTYFVLNVLALGAQVFAVGFLLRRFAPSTMVAVLPVLLTMSGGALAATGALSLAVVAKGTDGALRHGVYKTGLELLCIPLSDEGRRKVKTALEIVGQRGGQVLASTLILLVALLSHGDRISAFLVVGFALVWSVLSLRLHTYYVDQFRGSIFVTHPTTPTGAQLDVASLETLVATLDSESEEEVFAALHLLERERKHHLVPALILYHPNENVVVEALRLFARRRRRLVPHALDFLLRHASPRVRAEAYAAKVAMDPNAEGLEDALRNETAQEVRGAIVTALTGKGALSPTQGRAMLEEILERAAAATKVVVLETIGWNRVVALDDIAVRLADDTHPQVKFAAVHTLGELGTERAADALVALLVDETVQQRVGAALAQSGRPGFDALVRALKDTSVSPTLRWAVPRALVLVSPKEGADVLMENLEHESDGMVRYRTLVALGVALQRDAKVAIDKKRIDVEIRADVSRAYRTIDRRLTLEAGARADRSRSTVGHELLAAVLRDKEKSAIGRIFRLLGLAFPEHDFGGIYRALENGERPSRASAVELTSNLLSSPLREAVVGLIDDIDDEARLPNGAPYHERIDPDYDALVRRLIGSRSSVIRDVAAYHAAELGSEGMLDALTRAAERGGDSADVRRAIEVIGGVRSKQPPPAIDDTTLEVSHVG